MTNLARLPLSPDAYARITERQRAANIAAEGLPVNVYSDPRVAAEMDTYENYRTANFVAGHPRWFSAELVRDAQTFIRAYETAIPKGPAMQANPGPMPRQLSAADQHRLDARRKCVDGFDPDHIRPRDYGLACALAVPVVAFGYAVIAAVMGGW